MKSLRSFFAFLSLLALSLPSALFAGEADAKTQAEMKPYKQKIDQSDVSFEMVPIPGGEFLLGSPKD